MNNNHVYIMYTQYRTNWTNFIKYPAALIIKLAARFGYKKPYNNFKPSHVGLVAYYKDAWWIVEFMLHGLNFEPLKRRQEILDGHADFLFEKIPMDVDQLEQILRSTDKFFKQKYDKMEAAMSFFDQSKYRSDGTFCSEFVTEILRLGGIGIVNEKGKANQQEPIDLLMSKKVKDGKYIEIEFEH